MGNSIPTDPDNLTDPSGAGKGNGNVPIEPGKSNEDGLDPDTKAGFQTALNKKAEALRTMEERAAKAEEELRAMREERRKKKLEEMDDTQRLQQEKEDLLAENSKLRMRDFAKTEAVKRGLDLNDPLMEIILDTPWTVPAVKRSLGEDPTWAEVISAVNSKLPSYLDDLVSRKGSTPNNGNTPPSDNTVPAAPSEPVDPERAPNPPLPKRTWTRAEIANLTADEYIKHRPEIMLAEKEGRII